MFRSLLGGKGAHHGSTQSLTALEEPHQIVDAMDAATHIMNDDLVAAEEALDKGSSPFHKLGKGVVVFMQATLGFEQEIMKEASERLAEAENAATAHLNRSRSSSNAYHSPIYPPGTEYALCVALAQLMIAVVGVLNESLTEAVKGFYKLRKAFVTLDGILEAEKKFVESRSRRSASSSRTSLTALRTSTTALGQNVDAKDSSKVISKEQGAAGRKGDLQFADADESHSGVATPVTYEGHLASESSQGQSSCASTGHATPPTSAFATTKPTPGSASPEKLHESIEKLKVQDPSTVELFGDNPVDIFILGGSNMCFGIMLLMLSLVPPVFSPLLKIIGFRGDREKGISMLWQATKFHNIFGGISGLILFSYYNILLGFSDIITPSAVPRDRLKALLAEMRARYPKSHLWLLEEARMIAGEKQIEKALSLMDESSTSPLKQVEALQQFEYSMDLMFVHEYERASKSFQKCVTLNNWSHGLYYYIAGCCHVELYRQQKKSNPAEAEVHAAEAERLLRLVPQHTGKKRFMARQLPFDVFVNRKVQKWDQRAKQFKVSFVDAVGVSPIEEMIYFWSGHHRMQPEHLEEALARLDWSTTEENPLWAKESVDEQGIHALLKATTLRNLCRVEEAKEILVTEIMANDKAQYKGSLRDNWVAPCARYEMATCAWAEYAADPEQAASKARLQQCWKYLDEVSKWEAYDLDTRIGLKITTGKATMAKLGVGSA